MSKDLIFTYTKGYKEKKHADGYIQLIPQIRSVKLNSKGVKRYYSCLLLLTGIGGPAHDLLNWLTEQMDYENRVYNSVSEREKFVRWLKDVKKKHGEPLEDVPSQRTVEGYFQRLADRNLLIPERRGAYIVNPAYFMKDTNEGKRMNLLRIMLEFKDGKDTTIAVSTESDDYTEIKKK